VSIPVCKNVALWTKIKWAVVTRGLQVHVARSRHDVALCATTADPTDGEGILMIVKRPMPSK
jgi:hypothetical protein